MEVVTYPCLSCETGNSERLSTLEMELKLFQLGASEMVQRETCHQGGNLNWTLGIHNRPVPYTQAIAHVHPPAPILKKSEKNYKRLELEARVCFETISHSTALAGQQLTI